MNQIFRIDINILAIIILVILFFKAYNPSEKMFVHQRLFLGLILLNVLLIALDTSGWMVNGISGRLALFLNTAINLLLYILIPLAPALWILYTDYQIQKSEANFKKIFPMLSSVVLINALLSVVSLWTGWYFSIDWQNVYHRGNLFWIFPVICYSLILYSFFTVLFNRAKIERKHFISLLLFFVPYLAGTTLQVIYFGVSYAWIGMMVAMFIIYVNIQVSLLSTDYLTGVFNRRQLEIYLSDKIRGHKSKVPFSAILIDLNHFKSINDKYGHSTGDEALKDTIGILKNSLRQSDFIARYGGDEFIVVMNVDNREILNQTIERISHNVARFNSETQKPYRLSFAIGCDVYNPSSRMTYEEFLMNLDDLMYKNKNQKEQEDPQAGG
jgi:diguanylate cyclase (GGDEF)-like protein